MRGCETALETHSRDDGRDDTNTSYFKMPEKIPPIAHAVGGSVGSALALLLLYPLERARIEVHTVVARLESKEKEEQQEFSSKNGQPHDELILARLSTRATSDSTLSFEQPKTNNDSENHDDDDDCKDDNDNPDLLACFRRVWERRELYKGAGPLVITLATSNFVFFFVNALIKGKLSTRYCHGKKMPSYLSLLASCLAGSINVLLTNPLWVTNLRIITNEATYPSLWLEMVHVARTLGLAHLWQGTTASLLLVSNPVIQFFCYEQIKAMRLRGKHRTRHGTGNKQQQQQQHHLDGSAHLSPSEAFVLGALAKAVATVLTYPLQLTQAVLRMQTKKQREKSANDEQGTSSSSSLSVTHIDSSRAKNGTLECLMSIYARDGLRGMYTGMRAKLLQTVLTAAFTFLTYEQIIAAIHAVHKKVCKSSL